MIKQNNWMNTCSSKANSSIFDEVAGYTYLKMYKVKNYLCVKYYEVSA